MSAHKPPPTPDTAEVIQAVLEDRAEITRRRRRRFVTLGEALASSEAGKILAAQSQEDDDGTR